MAQLIVGALIAGCVFFAVVSTLVNQNDPAAGFAFDIDHFITLIAVPYVVVAVTVALVVGKFTYKKTPMADELPTQAEIESAHQQSLTERIIRCAILEGSAFFCLIAWMIEGSYWAIIGAGICLFLLVLNFPREDSHLHDIQQRLNDRN